MKKLNTTNHYEAPAVMLIECTVECGFNVSNISETQGHEVPDFIKQNEL